MAIISNATTIADAGAFSDSLGSLVHIKTLTASSSATVSFVHGSNGVVLDNTYPIYKFEFINIHAPSAPAHFQINFSTDSGSNYNVAKTSTIFLAGHGESDSSAYLSYQANYDSGQKTADTLITIFQGNGNDESLSGELTLYNPSSTTFAKHFMSRTSTYGSDPNSYDTFAAGYGNTTSAIDGVRFTMSHGYSDPATTGNIDSGKIKLYGIKDS
jgi:hypothetical protein|tara:strand:- start:1176 stop:1817 length:642 start_codon:yes stop_codon:yes gene_type:complete